MSIQKYGKMNLRKALDYAIRDYECKQTDVTSGYKIEGVEEPYWNYLSNDAWEDFKESISEDHKKQYDDADGGELKKKKGRWGMCPPKMASFGSSSRFLYNLSKEKVGFVFEKRLPTKVGPRPANLDGYLKLNDTDILVEAKCGEIYYSHSKDVSKSYIKVYDELKKRYSEFSYINHPSKDKDSEDKDSFSCSFTFKGKPIVYFDIKQLISHFLGITAGILEGKVAANIKFVYLIFNPGTDTCFDNEKVKSYKAKIEQRYDQTIEEIEQFGGKYKLMEQLFDAIMEIQSGRLKRKKDYSFKFYIADQNDYLEILKK